MTMRIGSKGARWAALLLLSTAAGLSGCAKPKLIPNTKIKDTKLNRDVLRVVETYRRAMERKAAPEILVLVHPAYRDNSGTPEANDDIDYAGLKEVLATRFKRASRVRYQIDFQRIYFKGHEALVDVWIDATFVYKHPGHTPRYRRFADYHRYRLLKERGKWRFIEGL